MGASPVGEGALDSLLPGQLGPEARLHTCAGCRRWATLVPGTRPPVSGAGMGGAGRAGGRSVLVQAGRGMLPARGCGRDGLPGRDQAVMDLVHFLDIICSVGLSVSVVFVSAAHWLHAGQ